MPFVVGSRKTVVEGGLERSRNGSSPFRLLTSGSCLLFLALIDLLLKPFLDPFGNQSADGTAKLKDLPHQA
jgi:hypothetical protein